MAVVIAKNNNIRKILTVSKPIDIWPKDDSRYAIESLTLQRDNTLYPKDRKVNTYTVAEDTSVLNIVFPSSNGQDSIRDFLLSITCDDGISAPELLINTTISPATLANEDGKMLEVAGGENGERTTVFHFTEIAKNVFSVTSEAVEKIDTNANTKFTLADGQEEEAAVDGALLSSNVPDNVASAVLGRTVKSIGKKAFAGQTDLTSITMPSKLSAIGEAALSGCTRLESVSIPSQVAKIEANTFKNCNSLTVIDFGNERTFVPPLLSANAFSGLDDNYVIKVPNAIYNDWLNTATWSSASISGHIVESVKLDTIQDIVDYQTSLM